MKKIYFLSILTAGLFAFNSCANDNVIGQTETNEDGDAVITNVVVTADDFVPQTRTAISSELAFTWAKNDKIGVFPGADPEDPTPSSQVLFTANEGGAGSATFNGSGWGLMPGRKYYAYFPYSSTAVDSLVKFKYNASATQTANNATTHLGANDLMYTAGTTPTAGNTAQFQFHHLSSIMKLEITVPVESASMKFTKLIMECADSIFPQVVSFNPTADVVKDSVETFMDKLTLTLGSSGAGFTPADGKLSVWFMVGAADLSGKEIKVTTYDGHNSLSGTFTGADQKSGRAHLYAVSVTRTNPEFSVDLGLPSGIMWAVSNLTISGLSNNEAVLGDYYGWGEVQPYYTSATVSGSTLQAAWRDGYSSGYVQGNYNKGNTITGTYTSKSHKLQKEDDAAYHTLGGNWRMPSIDDADELNANCTISTATVNGVSGVKFTSKINGNWVFFPSNGYIDGNSTLTNYNSGSAVGPRFWLTDCCSSTKAYQQLINVSSNNNFDHNTEKNKWRGTSIRPIYVPNN